MGADIEIAMLLVMVYIAWEVRNTRLMVAAMVAELSTARWERSVRELPR